MGLLPCPFCGSTNLSGPFVGQTFIECLGCRCYGPEAYPVKVDWYSVQWAVRRSQIVDAWNRRPSNNPACKVCGGATGRWGWYESSDEPVEYWLCYDCDKSGREPAIQVHPARA
jgi:hypothetical protein